MAAKFSKTDSNLLQNGFRLVLALAGGYVIAILSGKLLAGLLPLSDMEATAAGIMFGYVMFVLAGIWAFAASSPLRASLGLGAPIALMGLCVALASLGGAA